MKTETTSTISKGEMLGRIFAHQEKLDYSKQMIQLFLDNGLDSMDLTELRKRNAQAYDSWYKMYNRNNRLGAFITYTVLGR